MNVPELMPRDTSQSRDFGRRLEYSGQQLGLPQRVESLSNRRMSWDSARVLPGRKDRRGDGQDREVATAQHSAPDPPAVFPPPLPGGRGAEVATRFCRFTTVAHEGEMARARTRTEWPERL